ncbi:ABC transporter substrate-binding protein [Actibacterium mucosum KCTC 23349]|uniref:ABC transporter substrate-binding protein n=1 Tax=Actibacterium mucosum KCTC 23349 TaxID=1454373 RepID=A0A037ZIY6_9RHOB|nr:outer membrane lipid asymmetry maintenance protein MlaD [Actibacterium mucosum]KAJ56073.1 ABC transporter substrate-binding protein [Actibacterium mucosum KCTC 23349]
MSENRTEILVGAGVLAVAFGFALYAAQVAGLTRSETGQYDLTASFRSVQGISVGSDVKLAGVKVGTITGLDLNPTTFRADATLRIDEAIILPDDSAILVSSEGLLGGNFIEIVPGGSPFDLEPGGEIIDTQGAVSLVQLLMRFVGAAAGEDEGEN